MADTLLFRGGSSADISVSTVQSRELVIDTDTDQIVSGASKKKTVMENASGNAKIHGTLEFGDGSVQTTAATGGGAVDSVNGQTGVVVLDASDVGAATTAQGTTADSALQPGDNVSSLVNDAGYLTSVAAAPVDSVNSKTGVVVLNASDVGAATTAQGAKADSALQSGNNVSALVNDAGYLTSALQSGNNVSELVNDAGYLTSAAAAPVDSVNGQTGVVVLTATNVGAATTAQGTTADSAVQPGDNVSGLTNDADYVPSNPTGVSGADAITNMMSLTQSQYDAISSPNVSTLYVITP
ncbi:MAG: hypothetical protein HOL29_08745 [Euryarchaeota archaeon]|jgi:hypothetical protein|nr:hypothetical protein [Euryarchaeota archaeon]